MVDRDILTRVWNEMDYRINVCRITKGGHIVHLRNYVEDTWRVSLSIGVRITTIRCVTYLLRIFKMFYELMNNPGFGF
jgi:acyl-CoA hydrolase